MKAKKRIAAALERMSPAPLEAPDFEQADAFVWHVSPDRLEPVGKVNRVEIDLLVGIDRSRDTLVENTRQFARGLPANNALLWGARGMGKSSLVKAVHAAVLAQGLGLKIVELQREKRELADAIVSADNSLIRNLSSDDLRMLLS